MTKENDSLPRPKTVPQNGSCGSTEKTPEDRKKSNREIPVYDVFDKKQVWALPTLESLVLSLVFSPDGKTLASGLCEATVLL